MSSSTWAAINTSSISQQIFDRVQSDILTGIYNPGDRLLVLELAERFNASQAPVREALERLKSNELVVSSPNKGSIVSSISFKEIRDIFELREVIEVYAIQKILPFFGENDFDNMKVFIKGMDEAIRKQDMEQLLQCDLGFHGYLYEHCNNQITIDLWNRMKMKMLRFMAISVKFHTTELMVEEHTELLNTLRSKDMKKIKKHFTYHMRTYKLFAE